MSEWLSENWKNLCEAVSAMVVAWCVWNALNTKAEMYFGKNSTNVYNIFHKIIFEVITASEALYEESKCLSKEDSDDYKGIIRGYLRKKINWGKKWMTLSMN